MNSRKLFALFLVLALAGSALAVQQQRLYRTTTGSDSVDPEARGVIAIQQHSVFVEIIVQVEQDVTQIHQFAAVVGLVKKCKQVRNVFDNAVLWFNDQFLFGNKSNVTVNVTPPNVMGVNPDRNITIEDLLDDNRNNGTGVYNATTGGYEIDEEGVGPNEGGNPDRDGFIRAQDFRERWGGCFIPNGFVHAIGADDPYGIGRTYRNNATVEEDATGSKTTTDDNGEQGTVDDHGPGDLGGSESDYGGSPSSDYAYGGTGATGETRQCVNTTGSSVSQLNGESGFCTDDFELFSNIDVTKTLIDLDNDCGGCLFEYVGTFYITDPNNHRWMVDKMVYPLDVAGLTGLGEDPTNCHVNGGLAFACGLAAAERHRDRAEDDGVSNGPFANETNPNENFDNHCDDGPNGECTGNGPDPTDRKHSETLKLTTKEPIFTVHLQVDPWNPDRQGFPDEAIWRYRDGTLRVGMPYTEDENHFCHDQATVAGATRVDTGLGENSGGAKADAYEYDFTSGETGGFDYNLTTAPGNGSVAWSEFRRGPVGNTVECAIEYNFLIAVDFEAFDNTPRVGTGIGVNRTPVPGGPALPGGVWGNVSTQDEGEGENEIIRNAKTHGTGGVDEGDRAWEGNSHPHNPADQLNNTVCQNGWSAEPDPEWNPSRDGVGDQPDCQEKKHTHDAISLDLFFYASAPYFIETNPYWDHANSTDALITTGTPPVVDDQCKTAPNLPPSDYRRQAVEARIPIVCDVDAVDGFHLHDADGSQIIP